jgi:TRAP-type C4-dicarboxylate transport system permease small subunit
VRFVAAARKGLERGLEAFCIFLMVSLSGVILVAVVVRKLGHSFTWYDEVASIMLAWLTFYGAALAALKRAHLGFPALARAAPPKWRVAMLVVSEAFVIGFFVLLAWVGWRVVVLLEGDTLVSLPWVSVQFTQSVIPIGAALYAIAELLSLPDEWRRAREPAA